MTEVIVEQTSKAEFLNPWSFLGVKNGSLEDMSALMKNRIITHPPTVSWQYMPSGKSQLSMCLMAPTQVLRQVQSRGG